MSLALPPAAVADPGPPAQITTDTAQYCDLLATKMNRDADASFDAIALGDQGKELCAKGEIRAGIARLRRALMSLREDGDSDEVTLPTPMRDPPGPSQPASPAIQPPTVVGGDATDDGPVLCPPPPAVPYSAPARSPHRR